jgi:hypothetical protein
LESSNSEPLPTQLIEEVVDEPSINGEGRDEDQEREDIFQLENPNVGSDEDEEEDEFENEMDDPSELKRSRKEVNMCDVSDFLCLAQSEGSIKDVAQRHAICVFDGHGGVANCSAQKKTNPPPT